MPLIEIEDLKDYYQKFVSPSVARLHVAGDIDKDRVVSAFAGIEAEWKARDVQFPEISIPENPAESKIYFVDFPGAKQSVIQIGNIAVPRSDPDFYPATVINYKLGGSFNGIVNLILKRREGIYLWRKNWI